MLAIGPRGGPRIIFRLAFSQAEPPAAIMDHDQSGTRLPSSMCASARDRLSRSGTRGYGLDSAQSISATATVRSARCADRGC